MERLKQTGLLMLLVAAGLFVSSFHTPPPRFEDGAIKTIVIDAGHGGHDPGALGSSSKEKDLALAIALELDTLLKKNIPGINVVLTRDDDTFVELHKRAKHTTEEEADFFISIHCNSSTNKTAYGSETYVLGAHREASNLQNIIRENKSILLEEDYQAQYDGFDPESKSAYFLFQRLQNVYLESSITMASFVQDQFKNRVGRTSRGVKTAGYIVLWKATTPSILIETGFISNKNEEKFLKSKTGQEYLSSAIYRAIKSYNKERN